MLSERDFWSESAVGTAEQKEVGRWPLLSLVTPYCFSPILLGAQNAPKDNYVRTLACALLVWRPWMDLVLGVCYVEESNEAMLSRFGHRLELQSHVHSFDDPKKQYSPSFDNQKL